MNGKDEKISKSAEPTSIAFDRRGFLQALGISGAVTLAACERLPLRQSMPYLIPPEEITPGVPVRYASTCTGCAGACGLLVTVRDGRPIKLEGNPQHPLSRGGLCALGQAEIRGLYDAGRWSRPQIAGQPVDWARVDRDVAAALARATVEKKAVHVLAGVQASPTALKTLRDFLAPFGGTLFEYDPCPASRSSSVAAYAALEQKAVEPVQALEHTDVLVVLGADLLGTGAAPVADTAAYAARRNAAASRGALYHVQIEGSLSLTGAGADERWSATAYERTRIAWWLLRELAARVGRQEVVAAVDAVPGLGRPPLAAKLAHLLATLDRARGRSLIVTGSPDVGEQVAVALANRLLGNEGKTLKLVPSWLPHDAGADLARLRDELAGGRVAALFVLGLDPVDQFADGESWQKWLKELPLSVAITDRPTATAKSCKVVAAAHHGLECWHDFAPTPTLRTLAQPTIVPLYQTRHPLENFLAWSGASATHYLDQLRSAWQSEVFPRAAGALLFEDFWHQAVASGASPVLREPVAARAAAPTSAPDLKMLLQQISTSAKEVEVELVAQVGVRDGTRAFNPWLRELPDPLTRVAWLPAVLVAPARARTLGVVDGDVVRVQVGPAAVEMAARIVPGQHPGVVGVPVGYGRVDGDGGAALRNAYRLAVPGPASVARTGRTEALPLAQVHSSTEGRGQVHQVASPDEKVPQAHPGGVALSLWDERPATSPHWHMSINLDACTGCSSCVIACQAENNVPVVGPQEVQNYRILHWLRIDRYYVGDTDHPEVLFEPMLCAQCDNAPCETVCPVAATEHSQEGLNQQVYNRCVGTRYCANNCPYKVRRFNWFDYDRGGPMERMVLNPDVVVRERGVMEKCTFCIQRIQLARIEARGRGDKGVPEVQTACQQSCPAQAIRFGDGTNPESAVSKDRENPRAFSVLAELGTRPSITYLARVRSRRS